MKNNKRHKFTSATAKKAGSKGGDATVKNKGREYMVEIGKKGGITTWIRERELSTGTEKK